MAEISDFRKIKIKDLEVCKYQRENGLNQYNPEWKK